MKLQPRVLFGVGRRTFIAEEEAMSLVSDYRKLWYREVYIAQGFKCSCLLEFCQILEEKYFSAVSEKSRCLLGKLHRETKISIFILYHSLIPSFLSPSSDLLPPNLPSPSKTPHTVVPPIMALCALTIFGSLAWCWHCSVRKWVSWKSTSKELGGSPVEEESAQKSSSWCQKCLWISWHKLGVGSVLYTLVSQFLRHQYNTGNWEQLDSPSSFRGDSSPWYCLLQALCCKDVCWEVAEIKKKVLCQLQQPATTGLGRHRLCAWEAPAGVAGFVWGILQLLPGWISGDFGDSKASTPLHAEGLSLQLGPEDWLNCPRIYGSQKASKNYRFYRCLSSCCAVWQVQNGLALYATWTTIATLLNFAVVLIYKWNVSNETATTASLSILALDLVIW